MAVLLKTLGPKTPIGLRGLRTAQGGVVLQPKSLSRVACPYSWFPRYLQCADLGVGRRRAAAGRGAGDLRRRGQAGRGVETFETTRVHSRMAGVTRG